MKSNVKAGLAMDIARMRVRVFGALGVGGALACACKSSSDADGLVMAPMAATASSTSVAVATVDAGVDSGVHRPTVEPRAPNGQTCTREVHCVQALTQAPTFPFSQPYEKCDPAPLGETGHFSPMETASRRSEEPDACCYVSFVSCSRRGRGNVRPPMIGRPLRDARGEAILAAPIASNGWARCAEDHAYDEARARYWLDGAAAEHASVAEFARISLALLALGAPAELVADVHRAALDEIAHAETCFSIASRLSGRALGPGPLDVGRGATSASLEELVACTLRDGCLGEAAASIELAAMARDPENAPFADAIAKMAEDEARHAELAWRIVAFALDEDRAAALRAIEEAELLPESDVAASVLAEIVRPLISALATMRSPREGGCAREA